MMRQHDRRSVPLTAERALVIGARVGIIAGERVLADEQRTDVFHEIVDLGT